MAVSIFLRSSVVVAAFIIFLISSYLYGPQGRGIISFLTASYQTLGLLISFGLGRVVYQRVSKNNLSAASLFFLLYRYTTALSLLVFFTVALSVFLICPMFDLQFEISPIYFFLFIFNFPYFVWLNFSNYLYGVSQKTTIHDKIIFYTRCGQVLVLFAAALLEVQIETFLLSSSLIGFAMFLIESHYLLRNFPEGDRPSWQSSFKMFKDLLSDVKWPYIDSLAQISTPFPMFILGLYVITSELGHYNFALQILNALSFPIGVFQIKLQEKLALNISDGGATLIKRSFVLIAPISVLLIISGYIASIMIPHSGLTSFQESIPLLQDLLLTLPLTGYFYIFQSVWVGKHQPKLSSTINLITSSLGILTMISLAPTQGAKSAVIGMYVSLISGLLVHTYFLFLHWKKVTDPHFLEANLRLAEENLK